MKAAVRANQTAEKVFAFGDKATKAADLHKELATSNGLLASGKAQQTA